MSLKEPNTKSKAVKYVSSAFFILVGIVIILISIYFNASRESKDLIFEITMQLLSHIGIGLFVIGTLVLLFDINHWTDYFKERLTEIVTEKTYLKNFTPEQLSELQTDVLKAYFKNNEIGGADGFLQHYQKNIQSIIVTPHRIDVEGDLVIKYFDNTNSKFLVHEEMHWVCISNNGKIQSEIRWIPAENEFESIDIKKVELRHPTLENGCRTINYNDFTTAWKLKNDQGFIMPLKDYENLNELRVSVIVEYVISKERFIAWRMAHLSRNVTLTVFYPKEFSIISEVYCMGNTHYEVNVSDSGYYKWRNEGWFLPDEGIAFQLVNSEENSSQKNSTSNDGNKNPT